MILASAVPVISLWAPKFEVGHVNLTTPFFLTACRTVPLRWISLLFVVLMLGLDIAYLHTKFDNSSFSRSRDILGAHQNFNFSHDLTLPFSGLVCHPRASTSYIRPIYQI